MGDDNVQGYVVVNDRGRFLSRKKRWVQHTSMETRLQRFGTGGHRRVRERQPDPRRAWVHPALELRQGGEWAEFAHKVISAYYDRDKDCTVIEGGEMAFDAFLARDERVPES